MLQSVSCQSEAKSTAGEVDRNFGQDGVVTFDAGSMEEVVTFSEGGVAALTFDAVGPSTFVYTVRKFTSRGVIDSAYGEKGAAVVRNFRVLRMRAAPDGSVVLAAQRSRTDETKFLIRLTPQGSYDSSFGKNGVVEIVDSKALSFVDFDLGKTTGDVVVLGTRGGPDALKIVVKRFSSKGAPDLSWKNGESDVDFSRPAWESLKKPAWMAPVSLALDPLLEHIFIGGTVYIEAQPHMAILKLMASTGGTGLSGHGVSVTPFGSSGLIWEGAGAVADLWISRQDESVHAFGIDTNPMDRWIALDTVYDRKGQSTQRERRGWGMDFKSAFAPDGRLILITDREKVSWKGLAQPLSVPGLRAIAATADGKVILAEQSEGGQPVRLKRLSL